jgi:hypothetical protein
MGRINIPAASRVSATEDLYYKLQIIPDRIMYTRPGTSHNILKMSLFGETGFHSQIQERLEALEKAKRIEISGALYKKWLAYHSAATASQNLSNDPVMTTELLEFQRLACVGSSYRDLLDRAAKAAFWENTAEVPLPRITQQEHQAMG